MHWCSTHLANARLERSLFERPNTTQSVRKGESIGSVLGRRAMAPAIMGAWRGAADPRVSTRRRARGTGAARRGTAHKRWAATGASRTMVAAPGGTLV